jgi:hypothetical protein
MNGIEKNYFQLGREAEMKHDVVFFSSLRFCVICNFVFIPLFIIGAGFSTATHTGIVWIQ